MHHQSLDLPIDGFGSKMLKEALLIPERSMAICHGAEENRSFGGANIKPMSG
jgi:hypothetical protein